MYRLSALLLLLFATPPWAVSLDPILDGMTPGSITRNPEGRQEPPQA